MSVRLFLSKRPEYPATRPVAVVLAVRRHRTSRLWVSTPFRVAPREWSERAETLLPTAREWARALLAAGAVDMVDVTYRNPRLTFSTTVGRGTDKPTQTLKCHATGEEFSVPTGAPHPELVVDGEYNEGSAFEDWGRPLHPDLVASPAAAAEAIRKTAHAQIEEAAAKLAEACAWLDIAEASAWGFVWPADAYARVPGETVGVCTPSK